MVKKRITPYLFIVCIITSVTLFFQISCNSEDSTTEPDPNSNSIDINILPEKSIIEHIQLLDSSNAWMVASLPKGKGIPLSGIYRSSDGGKSWLLNYPSQLKKIYSMYFSNSSLGWVTGDSGMILKTTDGGTSWNSYQMEFRLDTMFHKLSFGSIQFVSQSTGWIFGSGSGYTYRYVYHTTDAGVSWKRIYKTDKPLLPLYMMKDKKGFISRYESMDNFGNSEIYFTEDNFQSPLVRRYLPDDPGMVQHLKFIDDKLGIIFGYSYFLTTDGGVYWKKLDTPFARVLDVILVDSKKILVSDGDLYHSVPLSIYQSTDEGMTWTRVLTNISSVSQFAFANDSTGILYGTYSKPLYRYRSGVWSQVN